jgi:hypothetical protein
MDDVKKSQRMRLEIGGPTHLEWASRRIGGVNWPGDSQCLAIMGEDFVRAVVVYNLFMECSCCAHIATNGQRNWATRGMLFGIFSFPFLQLKLRRITLPIAERNVEAQILALKLGFKFEGRLLNATEDDNEVLLGMLREDCIWIKDR